jgi:hypothetical protein
MNANSGIGQRIQIYRHASAAGGLREKSAKEA